MIMPDPIPHVPEPGDESKDEFKPAVNPSELNMPKESREINLAGGLINYIYEGGDNDPVINYPDIITWTLFYDEFTPDLLSTEQQKELKRTIERRLDATSDFSSDSFRAKTAEELEAMAREIAENTDMQQLAKVIQDRLKEHFAEEVRGLVNKYDRPEDMPSGIKERLAKLRKVINAEPKID